MNRTRKFWSLIVQHLCPGIWKLVGSLQHYPSLGPVLQRIADLALPISFLSQTWNSATATSSMDLDKKNQSFIPSSLSVNPTSRFVLKRFNSDQIRSGHRTQRLEPIGGPVSCTLGLRGFPRAATIREKETFHCWPSRIKSHSSVRENSQICQQVRSPCFGSMLHAYLQSPLMAFGSLFSPF